MAESEVRRIPPLMGEVGWDYPGLSPEGDDEAAQMRDEVARDRDLRAQLFARAFNTPAAQEALDILRHIALRLPRYVPGMTGDQAAAAIINRDAKLEFLDFIDEEIRKALEN